MKHEVFVASWKRGAIKVDVDRSMALQVAGSDILPNRYRFAHLFWGWIALLSMPAAIAIMYFYAWWVGLLVLIFGSPALFRATKTSAMQFMIDHSIENADFYQFARDEGIIVIRQEGC